MSIERLRQSGGGWADVLRECLGADDIRRDRLQGRRYSPVWVRVVDGGDHRVVVDRGTGDRCRCPGFQSQVQEPLTIPWSTGAPLDSEKHELTALVRDDGVASKDPPPNTPFLEQPEPNPEAASLAADDLRRAGDNEADPNAAVDAAWTIFTERSGF